MLRLVVIGLALDLVHRRPARSSYLSQEYNCLQAE